MGAYGRNSGTQQSTVADGTEIYARISVMSNEFFEKLIGVQNSSKHLKLLKGADTTAKSPRG